MIELHWTVLVYSLVTLPLVIWFIGDLFFRESYTYFGSKRKGEMGGTSVIIILLIAIWTLIWGGFFWW